MRGLAPGCYLRCPPVGGTPRTIATAMLGIAGWFCLGFRGVLQEARQDLSSVISTTSHEFYGGRSGINTLGQLCTCCAVVVFHHRTTQFIGFVFQDETLQPNKNKNLNENTILQPVRGSSLFVTHLFEQAQGCI